MPRWPILILALAGLLLPQFGHATTRERETVRAQNATRVLSEIMRAPDKRLPRHLMRDAYAIAVIPRVIKAGFVIGGRHGIGLIAIKSADGTWSNPSFLRLSGGSVGFQAGVQATDVILVFRTRRGVDSIVHGKFTLGANASVAAGPVGRDAHAGTDAQLRAEIYSYSRSRGLFLGVSLSGSALTIDDAANHAIYGEGVTPRRIFTGDVHDVPNAIVDFRDRLEEYTAR